MCYLGPKKEVLGGAGKANTTLDEVNSYRTDMKDAVKTLPNLAQDFI